MFLCTGNITLRRRWKEVEQDKTIKMSETITALEVLFDKLNGIYLEGKLPRPFITVQSSPKAYGHCTTKQIWKSKDSAMYEINLGAELINRPMANTAATICHEMVHLYCLTLNATAQSAIQSQVLRKLLSKS